MGDLYCYGALSSAPLRVHFCRVLLLGIFISGTVRACQHSSGVALFVRFVSSAVVRTYNKRPGYIRYLRRALFSGPLRSALDAPELFTISYLIYRESEQQT